MSGEETKEKNAGGGKPGNWEHMDHTIMCLHVKDVSYALMPPRPLDHMPLFKVIMSDSRAHLQVVALLLQSVAQRLKALALLSQAVQVENELRVGQRQHLHLRHEPP